MAIWRPSDSIRVKVIGLAFRGRQLLAAEVGTDDGRLKGVRPLGGSIQLGESREQALRREFLEELGSEIKLLGAWQAFENIYEHEGALGHEIVFAARIELVNTSFFEREEILFAEDDGTPCRAGWFDLATLRRMGIELYPTGLAGYLTEAA